MRANMVEHQTGFDACDRYADQLSLAREMSGNSKTSSSAQYRYARPNVIHGHHLPPTLQTAEGRALSPGYNWKDGGASSATSSWMP